MRPVPARKGKKRSPLSHPKVSTERTFRCGRARRRPCRPQPPVPPLQPRKPGNSPDPLRARRGIVPPPAPACPVSSSRFPERIAPPCPAGSRGPLVESIPPRARSHRAGSRPSPAHRRQSWIRHQVDRLVKVVECLRLATLKEGDLAQPDVGVVSHHGKWAGGFAHSAAGRSGIHGQRHPSSFSRNCKTTPWETWTSAALGETRSE